MRGKNMIYVTTSWDDGHKLDMRLATLLKKHGIKGTFDITQDVFELPTTFHTYAHYSDLHKILSFSNFSLINFKKYWDWEKLAMALFDRTCQTSGIFHLWGHSWEIEKNNGWQKLENIL